MIKEKKKETIDLKALIIKYSQYWYYFLLSILFFIFIAFLYNRFTIPEYSISTSIEIKPEDETGVEDLIPGIIDDDQLNQKTNRI